MKTILITVMTFVSVSNARADGFKCEGVNTGVKVQVYNHTNPSEGTRKAAVMIVSDSHVSSPNQTIAEFTDENHTLAYQGYGLFKAKVDLRYLESHKKGENIAGTKLGYLNTISLQVYTKNGQFTYNNASLDSEEITNGTVFDARISYLKRNGELLEEKAVCSRYLKH